MRNVHLIDSLIAEIDTALRTLSPPQSRESARANPSDAFPDVSLSKNQKKHVAGLMRVNHAGEVCAQALYQGQALTARLPEVKAHMTVAANEEIDHLAWCEKRLQELDSQPSRLNGLWYTGSFLLGAFAGLIGDNISLGFVMETERQVSAHLQQHLKQLPKNDLKSRLILEQMYQDETQHAQTAKLAGANELPSPIKKLMQFVSKFMTKTSFYY